MRIWSWPGRLWRLLREPFACYKCGTCYRSAYEMALHLHRHREHGT